MPWCGCVEHGGLEYITVYVKKYIEHLAASSGPPLVHNGPLGAHAFVKIAYSTHLYLTIDNQSDVGIRTEHGIKHDITYNMVMTLWNIDHQTFSSQKTLHISPCQTSFRLFIRQILG